MIIKITELQQITGVGFGTSGIRDTNEKLSDKTIYIYTSAFLKYVKDKLGGKKDGSLAVIEDRDKSDIKAWRRQKDCGIGVKLRNGADSGSDSVWNETSNGINHGDRQPHTIGQKRGEI
jgi:hypothetical protein